MKKLISLLKNKKGYSVVNVIISVLVILLIFSLLIEFTILGQRYSYLSQTSSFVTRVIGEQGGISNSIPNGYYDPVNYTKSSSLTSILNSGFSDAKFDKWSVRINGVKLSSGTNIRIPEKEKITIVIEGSFYPIFNFQGNSSNLVSNKTTRTTYSSFTPRTGEVKFVK